jgi:aspartokinase-like uncharacterized kinase
MILNAQAPCDSASTWTDLEQVLAGDRVDGVQDTANDGRIVQEVLAEPFPGTMSQGVTQLLR